MFPSSDVGPRELKMKQIKNWAGSETDKSSADYHPPKKIKFPLGVSLIAACYANDEEEFKQLLSMGIDIDTRNPDGMTCVHQCCINGDYEFLEFLIKEGADINVQDNEGWTPLHAAASVGREEMVRLLLDNGADVSLLSCEMELPVDVSQSDSVTDLLERE
ncbi:Protein phosphatase 1 regulatory (Inhibitor) subunit 12A [Fasciola gigantica]|uniref:Protein phosphatase 1 regulatory (Inhibitor) subunit 12A n=1 Tax=Fasciola gigantica TaxID=46835 RepID=A0A504Y511_FASGI|nr:Protein phosphatase 1 regulatory (Inhibitor) subunit 12A [Fasciola gigantica]